MTDREAIAQLKSAFCSDDAERVRQLLDLHPALQARINEPIEGADSPAILHVRSRAMLDVLLSAGADLNVKGNWWAGGFGLLHTASPDLARYAIERGAAVDVHAAARLGLMDHLRQLVSSDPALVHARGGDGQTPLHFAATVEVAQSLLDHGAGIDALDVDHESTPAQYAVRERQDVVRLLVARGCRTDILMAAALGDEELVRRHLDADPNSIRMRVSHEYFPMVGSRAGGTIYQWTLGWYVSAHQVARDFDHDAIFQLLIERSPDELKLTTACWLGDEAAATRLLKDQPGLATRLDESERRQLAHAARNNNLAAVRLMLAAGLPLDARGQHGATPLHWAAFHGNVEMVEILLRHTPPLDAIDADFQGTPLRWAIHGSEHGWHAATGNYAVTVEALLRAGAGLPDRAEGTETVREVLSRWGLK